MSLERAQRSVMSNEEYVTKTLRMSFRFVRTHAEWRGKGVKGRGGGGRGYGPLHLTHCTLKF